MNRYFILIVLTLVLPLAEFHSELQVLSRDFFGCRVTQLASGKGQVGNFHVGSGNLGSFTRIDA